MKKIKKILRAIFYYIGFISSINSFLYKYRTIAMSMWRSRNFKEFSVSSIIKEDTTISGEKYITVGKGSIINKRTILTAWDNYKGQKFSPEIIIGENVSIGEYNHITAINKITIEDGVLTGRWITITDNNHGDYQNPQINTAPSKRLLHSKGEVHIAKNVWIADKVTILPGVSIGESSVIGANSVVTKNIPAFCIACGNPAIIVKKFK